MTKKHSDKELQKLGQMIVDIQELGYVGRSRTLYFAFVKGVATGFGVFLGGTVLIGLLLWLLGLFDQVPLLQDVIDNLEHTINSSGTLNP